MSQTLVRALTSSTPSKPTPWDAHFTSHSVCAKCRCLNHNDTHACEPHATTVDLIPPSGQYIPELTTHRDPIELPSMSEVGGLLVKKRIPLQRIREVVRDVGSGTCVVGGTGRLHKRINLLPFGGYTRERRLATLPMDKVL